MQPRDVAQLLTLPIALLLVAATSAARQTSAGAAGSISVPPKPVRP